MTLKSIVDAELQRRGKTFKWLVGELEMSNDGLKGGLENESIKLRDLKKLLTVLNLPIENLFVGDNLQIQKGGKYNTQAHNSVVSEPEAVYKREKVLILEKQVRQLESQLADKDKIIELLSK
ncbi:MAG: hypothetical protein ACXVJE_19465 [Mucilaginibacter sp.]